MVNEFCNGLRVYTLDGELTIDYSETETPFNRWYNDENLIINFGK